jgi:hypothetical protein
VDLLARVGWAAALLQAGRGERELHPSLLRTAASTPLTAEARFDETGFRTRLAQFFPGQSSPDRFAPERPLRPKRLTGAIA